MTAYRLHNESGTHGLIDAVRSGVIGTPHYIASTFGNQAVAGNHRLQAMHWGGPLQDVGVYCLNAIRHIFEAEPVAVRAMASRMAGDLRFSEVDASVTASLRFEGDRLGQFFCSFGTAVSETIRVVGNKGEILVDASFRFESALRMRISIDGQDTVTEYPHDDHFAGQIAYFSDCIRTGSEPEANGEEGLADMRALLAIEEAARTGQTVALPPVPFRRRIEPSMRRSFPTTMRRMVF